jgi:hypothetical protein
MQTKQPSDPLTLDMLIDQLRRLREQMRGDTEVLIPEATALRRPVTMNAVWIDVVHRGNGAYEVPKRPAHPYEQQLAIIIH